MSNEMDIGEMKPGDYMIHVYLQKGKNFKTESEAQSLNALVALGSGGTTSYSKCKTDCPAASDQEQYWGEHFFFEPRGVTGEEISSHNVQFKLLDKGVFRDTLLGVFEIDVSQIYFMNDEHAIQHQWIALTNPDSSDPNSIKGYLKMSVAVQGPGDSSVKLTDDEGAENSEEQQVMMPSSIKKEYKQIVISFIEAQKLPKMDTFGSIDAFVQTKFQKKQYETQVVKAVNERCEFKCSFKMAVQWPLSNDRLILKIMDSDNMSSECIGSIYMSLKDIVSLYSNRGGQLMWKNVYGGPIGLAPSQNKKMMNENPEIASLWKGRILMHIQAFDSKAPEQGKFEIDQAIMQMVSQKEMTIMKEYEIQAEVGGGICLPDNRAYKVRIQIADFFLDTQDAKSPKASANSWNQRFEAVKFQAPYSSIEELDRVYFYLMDGSSPICFYRGKASDFMDRNPAFKWYALTNDRAIGKVEEAHDAGMIQIKLSINDLQRNPPVVWNQWPAWKEKPKKRSDPRILRCYIYQCKDLPSADSDGNSDPFIQIWDADNKDIKSITIEDSLNPIFMQVFEVQVDVSKRENAAPIVLNLFDSDTGILVGASRDFLGRAIIKMDDPCVQDFTNGGDLTKLDLPLKPTWHSIRAGSDEKLPECGKILCCFSLAPIDANFKQKAEDFNLSSLVETKELNIDIHALGLRELESFGIMPIKKAFVKFRPRSLLPPERAFAVTNVDTEPKETGPNPNINTLITFQAQLPIDNLYCPKLACEAYDFVCKGLSQPKIGTFSIDVGDIYLQQTNERKNQIATAEKLIVWLKQVYANANPGSVMSRQQKVAKMFGVELSEEITSIAGGISSRRGKKKKKKNFSNFREDAMERELPAASPEKSGSVSIDNLTGLGDTSIQDNRDPTMLIMEDDYGDENMMAPLLRDDGATDYIPLRQTGSAVGFGIEASEDVDALNNSALLRKIVHGSFPAQDDQSQEYQNKLADLLQKSGKADMEAQKQFGTALAKLRKKREERATKQGGAEKKRQNKILAIMEAKLLANLQQAKANQQSKNKDQAKIKKMLATLVLAEQGIDLHMNVVMPTYKHDDRLKTFRESFIPPESLFMSVGYDGGSVSEENPQGKKKHYRKYYMDELENNKEIFGRKPFQEFSIQRGQSRGLSKGMLSSMFTKASEDPSGFTSTVKKVGTFKGYVRVYNEDDDEEFAQDKMQKIDEMEQILMKLHEKKLGTKLELDIQSLDTSEEKHYFRHLLVDLEAFSEELYKFFLDSSYESILIKQLSSPQDCLVRLYLLEGFDFASRDLGSFSDPYMVIRCGKTVHNMRDKYQLDEPNPKIHQVFEFSCRFPGTSPLEIEAYDYDDLFGDDLIGRTVLDLDDRFFSPEWRGLLEKPIEYRELYHPSTSLAQGTVLCWVDIFEQDGKRNAEQEAWNIQPEPITDYQLRLSVYEAANVPMEDAEGTSDVFVRAWIDENDKKETDTHWRCSSGAASFNYRLLFDFKSPTYSKSEKEAYKLKLQLYDRDLFKSNDFICLFEIDLRLLVLDCRISKKPQQLSQKYYSTYFKNAIAKESGKDTQLEIEFFDEDSFWLSVKRPQDKQPIKIRLDIRILPGVDAINQAVGAARTEPNHSPKLPEPVGRMTMSLNPFTMLGQLVGPELRSKIQRYMCLIICVALMIAMAPMILSNIITKLLLSPIGLG